MTSLTGGLASANGSDFQGNFTQFGGGVADKLDLNGSEGLAVDPAQPPGSILTVSEDGTSAIFSPPAPAGLATGLDMGLLDVIDVEPSTQEAGDVLTITDTNSATFLPPAAAKGIDLGLIDAINVQPPTQVTGQVLTATGPDSASFLPLPPQSPAQALDVLTGLVITPSVQVPGNVLTITA